MMTTLKGLKLLLKTRITNYLENGMDSDAYNSIDPEFLAEEMLNKYPRDFSNFRKKNFRKFISMVRFILQELNLDVDLSGNEFINGKKSKKDKNHSDENSSSDDYSMPESTHNLNDWITSCFQEPPTPNLSDCFTIDKKGDTNSKRKVINLDNKLTKKIRRVDESSLKTPEVNDIKVTRAKKESTPNKAIQKTNYEVINPKCDFSELVGLDDVIARIKDYLHIYSLGEKKLMRRGFLFSGASGTGKTTLAKCISHKLKMHMLVASSSQLLDGLPSERGENVDKLFEQALSLEPCFILIEKIELFMNDSKESSSTSLLSERLIKNIDDLNLKENDVWLLATTSKVENVDPQLLKGRRFQKTFHLPLPNLSIRINLLRSYMDSYLTNSDSNIDVFINKIPLHETEPRLINRDSDIRNNNSNEKNKNDESNDYFITNVELNRIKRPVSVQLSSNCTMEQLAEKTPSFSAPDLMILVEEAIIHSFNSLQLTDATQAMAVEVTMGSFEKALSLVKPSTMSEDIVSVPEVTWDDIGALGSIRDDLSWLILKHIKHPEVFEKDRLPLQGGVMLYGPPGCGKTLIAKAIANEACLNFISVAGPELKDKYVGESEKNIRMLFRRAQECAPCLIFFDEIDSICSTRGFGSEASGGINVVQQMLTELDGVRERHGVYVMGATNRIDQVDPAFLRENRFGTRFYVGLPTAEGRYEILQSLTRNGTSPEFSADVDLREVAEDSRCENLNGADLLHLVREATLVKLKNQPDLQTHQPILRSHVEQVLQVIKPTVSQQHLKLYQDMARNH